MQQSSRVSEPGLAVHWGSHQTGAWWLMSDMETTALRRRSADHLIESQPTLLLTLTEVAAHLRCTGRSVERQVGYGHLHVLHIGPAVRVERSELDRYLIVLRFPVMTGRRRLTAEETTSSKYQGSEGRWHPKVTMGTRVS